MIEARVAICMPVWDRAEALTELAVNRLLAEGQAVGVFRVQNTYLGEARNRLVIKAASLMPRATHILFVDGDMIWGPDALPMLLASGLPVVSGWYCARTGSRRPVHRYCHPGSPYMPLECDRQQLQDHWDAKEPREVHHTGGGFLLCRFDIFERIPYPWFRFMPRWSLKAQQQIDSCPQCEKEGLTRVERAMLHTDGAAYEDVGFGMWARHNGVIPYVHSGARVAHLAQGVVWPRPRFGRFAGGEEGRASEE